MHDQQEQQHQQPSLPRLHDVYRTEITGLRHDLNLEWTKPKMKPANPTKNPETRDYSIIHVIHSDINQLRARYKEQVTALLNPTPALLVGKKAHETGTQNTKKGVELSKKEQYERVKAIKQRLYAKQPTTFLERIVAKIYDRKMSKKQQAST